MRCIAHAEVSNLFGAAGFSARFNAEHQRTPLVLRDGRAAGDMRIGGRPTVDPSQLAFLVLELNCWLPNARPRLVWVDDWNPDYPGVDQMIIAARTGLGELRSLNDAPGHLFEAHDYHEMDQLKISADQTKAVSILTSLISLIMIASWDAWLISDKSTDRIEFWEGNIFFYAHDSDALARAEELLGRYKFHEPS